MQALDTIYNELELSIGEKPHITSVGAISTGKSSVIQNLIGIYFLPTDDSACTNRPIDIELIPTFDKRN